MSGSASLTLEQGILQHTLGIAAMAFPAQVYVALCANGLPPSESVGGVEAFGGGYARVAATFALLAYPTNTAANAASVEFPLATADWGELGYFEIWTAQTGGSRLYWGGLVDPVSGNAMALNVSAGDIVRFSAGSLAVEATAPTVIAATGVSSFNARIGAVILSNSDVVAVLPPSVNPPLPPGVASAGTSAMWARGDHVHPRDAVNVLSFGADPTGAADSTTAFRTALATTPTKSVYAPAGIYRLTNSITVGDGSHSQSLYGDGWATVLSVGPDFSSSASGVVILHPYSGNDIRTSVHDLKISFKQPPDIMTTTTASSASGATTITVASVAGVVVGDYVWDYTNPNNLVNGVFDFWPTVVSIAGNVVTLSRATLATVASGDSIGFGSARSRFVTLSAGTPSLSPGAPGIKYPWAIYAAGPYVDNADIDEVMISGAWDGVYIRGSGHYIGQLFVGAFDVGLDIDDSANFGALELYEFFNGYGINGAIAGTYYDGQAIAANLGQATGWYGSIQSWIGKVNLTSRWAGGSFGNVEMDGNCANFTMSGTDQLSTTQIATFYSSKSRGTDGAALTVSSGFVSIAMLSMYYSGIFSAIHVTGGTLDVHGGRMWDGIQAAYPMISVDAGTLSISDTTLDSSVGRTDTYLLAGNTATLRMQDCSFAQPAGTGAIGVQTGGNTTGNVSNIAWNGWNLAWPGPTRNNGATIMAPADNGSMQSGSISFGKFGASNHNSTAYGAIALASVLDAAINNTAFGAGAGNGVTTGGGNTFVGTLCGFSGVLTGSFNTSIGAYTFYNLTTGNNNTIIGNSVGVNLTTGSGNVYVGAGNGGIQPANESNTLRLGNNNTANVLRATNIDTTAPKLFLDWLPTTTTYANDAAAQVGGVAIGQLYLTPTSGVQCRRT